MAAPFGSQNIASTGSAYASEAGYTNFFRVKYSDDVRLKSMRVVHPLLTVFEREILEGAPLVVHLVKKVEEGFRQGGTGDTGSPQSVLEKNRNRVAALTYQAVPTETRTVLPDFWNFPHLFDPRDRKALMRDVRPGSNFQTVVISSLMRKMEKKIIQAIDGPAVVDGVSTAYGPASTVYGGATNEGGFEVGVLSGSPDTLTGASPGTTVGDEYLIYLTTQKLLDARGKIEEADGAMPGDRLVCIMSARQHRLFMQNDPKVVNMDFNRSAPLSDGIINDWLGMDIIVSNAIEEIDNTGDDFGPPTTDPFGITESEFGNGATGEFVYVCTRDALLTGMDPVDTRFDIIPERGHALQLAHYSNVGAVRLDAKKICRIQCATAATV